MKCLIIKDLLNIIHNVKSLILMLAIFAFAFIPSSGPSTYVIISSLMCGMMVITTYAFDERANWDKYALTLPIRRQDVVKSKFVVLYIFTFLGALWGTIVGYIGAVVLNKGLIPLDEVLMILATGLIAIVIASFGTSVTVPIIVKKGAEKARLLSFVAFLIPTAIIFLLMQAGQLLQLSSDSSVTSIVIVITCLLGLILQMIPYKIASAIYAQKSLI